MFIEKLLGKPDNQATKVTITTVREGGTSQTSITIHQPGEGTRIEATSRRGPQQLPSLAPNTLQIRWTDNNVPQQLAITIEGEPSAATGIIPPDSRVVVTVTKKGVIVFGTGGLTVVVPPRSPPTTIHHY